MATLPLLDKVRLQPELLTEADYPSYRALYADPRVAPATGLPTLVEESAARRWFDNALALPAEQGRILALRLAGEPPLVGILRLTEWNQVAGVATLGYALTPRLWGQGLMNECLYALLPWLLAEGLGKPLHRLQAWVLSSNVRSRHLLAGLGFVHEGTLRGLFFQEGGHHDICAYGLLTADKRVTRIAHPKPGRVELSSSAKSA